MKEHSAWFGLSLAGCPVSRQIVAQNPRTRNIPSHQIEGQSWANERAP
ncbi:hypothetical protein THTE_0787 [Thermogutta terrifontis]|uniref:Uncharacterized protein n=1 Tax=Thermogutta terrifontis TaxID=1331910 RepID=A0A286RBR2_9BACT|nr:hypothetical protein THTE_0787 [Thermogutta terrifontis]